MAVIAVSAGSSHTFSRRTRDPIRLPTGLDELGLMAAVLDRDAGGGLIRKAGVMATAVADGIVRPGDPIRVQLPAAPHAPLAPV